MTSAAPAWRDPQTVRSLLTECDTWAVVGLSGDPSRDAFRIAALLQARGKRIVPVHPDAPTVLGEPGYAALAEVPFALDVVDVFRRSEAAGAVVDEALALATVPRGIWLQLGVLDAAAFARAQAAGVPMVMDSCPAIEWPRLDRQEP
ncbi:CoA-binding protein [Nocardioides sp.]|uniref:CoA-binding protein n=1 Tax=Nocardioides sp. TaxID=35761 RepID=UPI003514EF2F